MQALRERNKQISNRFWMRRSKKCTSKLQIPSFHAIGERNLLTPLPSSLLIEYVCLFPLQSWKVRLQVTLTSLKPSSHILSTFLVHQQGALLLLLFFPYLRKLQNQYKLKDSSLLVITSKLPSVSTRLSFVFTHPHLEYLRV